MCGSEHMTREELQQHILDVSTGRVRLDMSPDQLDHYIQQQYKKLRGFDVSARNS
jgi:hypothetical protein